MRISRILQDGTRLNTEYGRLMMSAAVRKLAPSNTLRHASGEVLSRRCFERRSRERLANPQGGAGVEI